jgi:hypothetical protein
MYSGPVAARACIEGRRRVHLHPSPLFGLGRWTLVLYFKTGKWRGQAPQSDGLLFTTLTYFFRKFGHYLAGPILAFLIFSFSERRHVGGFFLIKLSRSNCIPIRVRLWTSYQRFFQLTTPRHADRNSQFFQTSTDHLCTPSISCSNISQNWQKPK